MSQSITLRELCSRLNISRRTIQGYEKAGLVSASGKNKYGHLLYDEQTQKRIQQIHLYQQIGFKIKEISQIIDGPDEKAAGEIRKKIALLKEKEKQMEKWIKEANAMIENNEKREK